MIMAKYDSMLVEKKGNVGYVFINNVENQNRIGRKEAAWRWSLH